MSLGSIANVLGRHGHRALLLVQKHSPEILTTVGIVGSVTSTVLASKATLKLEEVVEEFENGKGYIEHQKTLIGKTDGSGKTIYTKKELRHDIFFVNATNVIKLTKLYLPAVAVGGVSIACLISSHNILQQRNTGLTAAYIALDQAHKRFVKRVEDEVGVERATELKYDLVKTRVDDTKAGTVTEVLHPSDPTQLSHFAKFFDETSPNWDPRPDFNRLFLETQQGFANDLLQARGHVFLNEVYTELGIPHTPAGAVTGWVKGGGGDDFISFSIFDAADPQKRDFVNGFEGAILLDFNVDGPIWDLI